MSRQSKRHLQRQPTEEAIRIAVSDFVAGAGDVDVQRMAYDWRADDALVQIRLAQPISGITLQLFQRELCRVIRSVVPEGDPLQDWLVVVECFGELLARVDATGPLEWNSDE